MNTKYTELVESLRRFLARKKLIIYYEDNTSEFSLIQLKIKNFDIKRFTKNIEGHYKNTGFTKTFHQGMKYDKKLMYFYKKGLKLSIEIESFIESDIETLTKDAFRLNAFIESEVILRIRFY